MDMKDTGLVADIVQGAVLLAKAVVLQRVFVYFRVADHFRWLGLQENQKKCQHMWKNREKVRKTTRVKCERKSKTYLKMKQKLAYFERTSAHVSNSSSNITGSAVLLAAFLGDLLGITAPGDSGGAGAEKTAALPPVRRFFVGACFGTSSSSLSVCAVRGGVASFFSPSDPSSLLENAFLTRVRPDPAPAFCSG
jgi:hypothetical protein